MMPALPTGVVVSFAALTLALLALWAPRVSASPRASYWWALPFAAALAAASSAGVVAPLGLLTMAMFAGTCRAAASVGPGVARLAAHVAMLAACVGLFLHVMPGFENPQVLAGVVLTPGSEPYTKYLNFDKGVAGLLLLGLYAPDLPSRDPGPAQPGACLRRFALVTATVMALSLTSGYVRWDPKVPPWWPMWMWSMIFLTALPEEAVFRGLVQTWISRRLGGTTPASAVAIVSAGALFGVAHAGGGLVYVALATAAGIGYGWIYAATGSMGAAIASHAALNGIHFLFFSYPALARQ